MNLTKLIDLKERIAISPEYTADERDFILEAINHAVAAAAPPMTVVHNPQNYLGRIDGIHMVLSVDDGGEGVVAAPIGPGGMTVPLIAADARRLKTIRDIAPELVRHFGKVLRLAKFTKREDLEVWRP
jgi:hypothetical protein